MRGPRRAQLPRRAGVGESQDRGDPGVTRAGHVLGGVADEGRLMRRDAKCGGVADEGRLMRRDAKCGEGVERGRRVRLHLLGGIAPDDDRELFRPPTGVQRVMRGLLPTVRDKGEGNRGTREALDEVFGPGQGPGEVDVAASMRVV